VPIRRQFRFTPDRLRKRCRWAASPRGFPQTTLKWDSAKLEFDQQSANQHVRRPVSHRLARRGPDLVRVAGAKGSELLTGSRAASSRALVPSFSIQVSPRRRSRGCETAVNRNPPMCGNKLSECKMKTRREITIRISRFTVSLGRALGQPSLAQPGARPVRYRFLQYELASWFKDRAEPAYTMRFKGFICGRPVAWLAVCAHQSLRPGSHRRSLCPHVLPCGDANPDYTNTQAYTYYRVAGDGSLTPLETNEMRITFIGLHDPIAGPPGSGRNERLLQVGWSRTQMTAITMAGRRPGLVRLRLRGVRPITRRQWSDFAEGQSVHQSPARRPHERPNPYLHFWPCADRNLPLRLGFGRSGVESPPGTASPTTTASVIIAAALERALRWHTESFSFQSTFYTNCVPATKEAGASA